MLQEADRLKCATNVLHKADQACRRLISEAMKSAKGQSQASLMFLTNFAKAQKIMSILSPTVENHVLPEDMRSLAAQLSESKTTFLHDLRRQLLQEASFTEEDIDVERVVKRAVNVFDRERQEVLLGIMNKKT